MRELQSYEFPGNVRELDHAVERAVLMARGALVESGDLGLASGHAAPERALEEMSLDEVECFLIKRTLARFDGNVALAAEALGLSRSALYRRLQRYGL
jgi:DNA-binding NtrC family response regulator